MPRNPSHDRSPAQPSGRRLVLGALVLLLGGILAASWWVSNRQSGAAMELAEGLSGPEEDPGSESLKGPVLEYSPDGTGSRSQAQPADGQNPPAGASSSNRIDTGSVSVRILDLSTGEALPAYAIAGSSLNRSGGQRVLETDREGLVRWSGVPLNSNFELVFVDHVGVQRAGNQAKATVPVGDPFSEPETAANAFKRSAQYSTATGPTYFLQTSLPAGYNHEGIEVYLQAFRPGTQQGSAVGAVDALLREPHPETIYPGLPWVRLGDPVGFINPSWLELRTFDGRFHAGAWVEHFDGICAQPLQVTFQRSTSLAGEFDWGAGNPRVGIRFSLVESDLSVDPEWAGRFDGLVQSDGTFVFENLEPGNYELEVQDIHWQPVSLPVVVRPGSNGLGKIALRPLKVVGNIQGVVRSSSDTYRDSCFVKLGKVAKDGHPLLMTSVRFVDDGAGNWEAPFDLRGVTEGAWVVYAECQSTFVFDAQQTVSAPAKDVVLLLDDASVSVDIIPVDAQTGEELQGYVQYNWSIQPRGRSGRGGTSGARLVGKKMPNDPSLIEFEIYAEGYQARKVVYADFKPVPGTPNALSATVPMKRGWGGKALVVDSIRGQPLPGARILLDGEDMGKTDQAGELWLARSSPPAKIRVEKQDWHWLSNHMANAKTGDLLGTYLYLEMAQLK